MKKAKKTSLINKVKKNPWIVSTVVLAVVVLVMAFTGFLSFGTTCTGFSCSGDSVGEDFVEFINSKGGAQIELVKTEDFSPNLYQVTVLADGNEVPAHVTKDGKYFVQVVSPLVEEKVEEVKETPAKETQPEVVKADKPKVELFVMSHCPFGTQAMKGMIPTVKALGDTIDFDLRFVNYAMHGEKEVREQINMYCIDKEQDDKYYEYLECFLGTEAGSAEEAAACRVEVGIDEAMLSTCVEAATEEFDVEEMLADKSARFPKFLVDDALNKEYGVRGSPTLVVNGVQASSGRDSQSYLDVICASFNDVPEVCGTVSVSSASPSPGFGYETTSNSGSAAQCG